MNPIEIKENVIVGNNTACNNVFLFLGGAL